MCVFIDVQGNRQQAANNQTERSKILGILGRTVLLLRQAGEIFPYGIIIHHWHQTRVAEQ